MGLFSKREKLPQFVLSEGGWLDGSAISDE
jgi:hypothetical protein